MDQGRGQVFQTSHGLEYLTSSLALLSNAHPVPPDDKYQPIQRIYQAVVPEWGGLKNRPSIDVGIAKQTEAIQKSGLYEAVEIRKHPFKKSYTTLEYLKLMNTYSDHRSLDSDRRGRLFEVVAEVIEMEFNGLLEKEFVAVAHVALREQVKTY